MASPGTLNTFLPLQILTRAPAPDAGPTPDLNPVSPALRVRSRAGDAQFRSPRFALPANARFITALAKGGQRIQR